RPTPARRTRRGSAWRGRSVSARRRRSPAGISTSFGEPVIERAGAGGAAWRLLGAALVAQVGISVVEQGIPSLTGFVKNDLGLSAATAGLVVSSFTFGRIFGAYGAGVAADRIGERTVLVAGGVAGGALVALAAATPLPGLL